CTVGYGNYYWYFDVW
nr:immunoglobulin heavy chain junction region [Mus musculus]